MRIYTPAGDLAFKTFSFPDGQPHFKLETYEHDFAGVTIELAIKSPLELFQLGLAVDVLHNHGYSEINLDVRYLLGARMDRAIDSMQPYTLQSVARHINSLGFAKVRILDVHSEVATRLIRNSNNVFPFEAIRQVLVTLKYPVVVCPDKGAYDRVSNITHTLGVWDPFVQCGKIRDPHTGTLSGFKVNEPSLVNHKDVIILDDICDGGGTFVGLAKELRKFGAKKVSLFVTHNVQNKDRLEGIDRIFTTDSFSGQRSIVIDGQDRDRVVIPISMKEL